MITFTGDRHTITLDENHVYRVDGIIKPGANQIMKEVGLSKDWSGVDTFYRDRGIAVHQCIDLYLRGELDESTVDPVCVPYFEQFKGWLHKNEASGLVMSERPLYSEPYDFCGTVDLIMNKTIYDVKCSKRLDSEAKRQYRRLGSAYRTLVANEMGLNLPFKLLLLTGDGDAVVVPMDCPLEMWDAIMVLHSFAI